MFERRPEVRRTGSLGMSRIRKAFLETAAILAVTLALVLMVEGAIALIGWNAPQTSATYAAVRWVKGQITGKYLDEDQSHPGVLVDADELEALVPLMVEQGIGMGNVPFEELATEASRLNTIVDGCYSLKPNLDKTLFYLRSQIYNPLDPITVFYDTGLAPGPALRAFFDTYGLPPVRARSNAVGERVTVPLVERERKVIVAGDSVAFGAMIDDADTIASQLQALDSERQYVSVAVGGADARDVVCNLERAAQRYDGQIDELIYVYCENDFNRALEYGTPEEVVAWLQGFVQAQGIASVTVLFAPYVYNIVPQYTRFPGARGGEFPTYLDERHRLEAATHAAGFRWLSIGEIVRGEDAEFGTQFATLHNFVDHTHLSRHGVAQVVAALRAE
jgi:hypothetical protein